MNFKELCQLRYSVRSYKPDAIPSETMEYIKECARLAPSAVNRQPWQFFTITNAGEAWTRRYDNKNHADIDASIAIEHICLAAAEQGLGTCWVCNFRVQMCQELFQIPEHLYPVAIIPIGYPASAEVPEKTRKEMSEIWTEQK